MANEITVSAKLSCTKSGTTVTGDSSVSITLTGVQKYSNTQTIGTSEEVAAFPADLVTEGVGYMWFKNLDATNFVTIRVRSGGTSYSFGKMLPGETALFRTNQSATNDPAIWLLADTGACNVQIVAVGT